jgi:hypothetical protein
LPSPTQNPKKKKALLRLLNWLHEKFYFQNGLSPFIYLFGNKRKVHPLLCHYFQPGTDIHSKLGTRLLMSKAGDQRVGGNPVATDRPSRCTTHHTLRWDLARTKRVTRVHKSEPPRVGRRRRSKESIWKRNQRNGTLATHSSLAPLIWNLHSNILYSPAFSFESVPSCTPISCHRPGAALANWFVFNFFAFSKKNRALGFSTKVPSRLFLATRRYVCIYVCMFVSLVSLLHSIYIANFRSFFFLGFVSRQNPRI